MKTIIAALLTVVMLLSGCGHAQHGIRAYAVVKGKDGTEKSVLIGSANADFPGAKKARLGDVEFDIDPNVTFIREKYDNAGKLVLKETLPGGIYTSEVTRAQGDADRFRIGAVSTGVSSAIAAGAAASAAAGIIGPVGSAIKP
jgi:hypothetical protein